MNPALVGTIAAGALCAVIVVAALIRRQRNTRRLRRDTLIYNPDLRTWIPARQHRLEQARSVGKELITS